MSHMQIRLLKTVEKLLTKRTAKLNRRVWIPKRYAPIPRRKISPTEAANEILFIALSK
jgi:hypothetical protein